MATGHKVQPMSERGKGKVSSPNVRIPNDLKSCDLGDENERKNGPLSWPSKFKLPARRKKSSDLKKTESKLLEDVSLIGLFRYATAREKLLTLFAICLSILCGCLQPLHVPLMGQLADLLLKYEKDKKTDEFWDRGVILMILNASFGLGMAISAFILFLCYRVVCNNIVDNLRIRLLESLLRQDAEWYDEQKFGALNSQLNESIDHIRIGLGDKIDYLFRLISMSTCFSIVSFLIDWKITLTMIAIVPISGLCTFIMSKMISSSTKRQILEGEKAGAILQESIMNVKTVQSCNAQSTMVQKYLNTLVIGRRFNIKGHFWHGFLFGLFFCLLFLFNAIGVYFGFYQIAYGESVSPGDVLTVTRGLLWAGYITGILSPHVLLLTKAKAAAAYVYRIIERTPKIDATSVRGKTLFRVKGKISFENVVFEYPNRKGKKILDGLSWSAEPGETVALVGHSGSGKSTCMSLLTRMYDCAGGHIKIDEIDVKIMNIRALRKMIGIVQQEPTLFGGTIAENVALSSVPEDDRENLRRIEVACRLANAHEFIEALYNGYQTPLGPGGVQLSGGQKQRVAIARTLYQNPSILLLDEATSALDAESEVLVQKALQEASKDRTTIVIAHRLSTLRNVDKIVVVDKGRVIETGTHSELLENSDSFYSRLVKAQEFDENDEQSRPKPPEPIAPDRPPLSEKRRIRSETKSSALSMATSLLSMTMEQGITNFKRKLQATNRGLFRLYRNCHGNYLKISIACVVTFFRSFEVIFIELLLLSLYGAFKNYNPAEKEQFMVNGTWITLGYVGLALFILPAVFGSISTFGWSSECVTDDCKVKALESVLDQDAVFFDQPQTSNAKVIQRISTDSLIVKASLDSRCYFVLNNFLGMVELLVATMIFSWHLALAGIALSVAELVLLLWIEARMQNKFRDIRFADESSRVAVEIIENTKTMQLLGKEQYFLEKYAEKLRETRPLKFKAAIYEALIFSMSRAFIYVFNLMSFAYGIYLIYHNFYTSDSVFISTQLLSQASDCIILVAVYMNDYFRSSYSADSLFELIGAKSEIRKRAGNLEQELSGDVEIRKVDFAYPTRPEHRVANGLSLLAFRGESIALVGPSGGGKSTVINLLLRFYEPFGGKLKIDRVDLPKYGMDYLRSKMALVGQEPVLFSGTIADNIKLGCQPEPTFEEIQEACRIANAVDFIEQLPLGYSTEVGEKGSQLSGGQKQRIAIARALVRKPKILLLDEATSALDAQSEQAVQKALESARQGRTCITIAHRLSSIQNSDRIYFIKNGRVVESGTHTELSAKPDSAYAQLMLKQKMVRQATGGAGSSS